MEINLDNKILEESMSKAVTSAVSDSIGSYDIGKIIKDHVSKSIVNVAIEETINKAFYEMDTVNLTKMITKEIEKAVVSIATHTIKETMCTVVFQLRSNGEYLTTEEARKRLLEIREELKHS